MVLDYAIVLFGGFMNFVKSFVFVVSALLLISPSASSCFSANDVASFVQNDRVWAFIVMQLTANHVYDILGDAMRESRDTHPVLAEVVPFVSALACGVAAGYYPGKGTIALGTFYSLCCSIYLGHEAWQAWQDYRKEKAHSEADVLVSAS